MNLNTNSFIYSQELDVLDKVFIINCSNAFTGLGRYAQDLLTVTGKPSNFFHVTWDRDITILNEPDVKLVRTPTLNIPKLNRIFDNMARIFPRLLFAEYFNLIKKIKNEKGIIHYSSQLIPPSLPDSRDIVTIHDLFALGDFLKQPINELILKKFLHFENIITDSNVVADQITTLRKDSEPCVIHPYVSPEFHKMDKNAAREITGIVPDSIIILNVASVQARKNQEVIGKVMKKLGNQYKLVRVGKRYGSEINFENVSYEFLNAIYNSADILFFPTLGEGFGFPLIEAMACGLPIVTSELPITREVAGDAAVYVNPSSIEDMVEAVKETSASSNRLVQRELERVKYFSFQRFKSNLIDYYKKVDAL